MRRWWWVVPVVALLLWQKSCADRQAGALQAEVKAAEARYAALEERGVVLDTQYVTDTLRLDRFRGKYEALRDSVLRAGGRIDATFIPDLVHAADSTIHACSIVLLTCDSVQANLRAQIGNLRTQLGLERKRRPGIFSQLGQKILWGGIGFGAAKVLAR